MTCFVYDIQNIYNFVFFLNNNDDKKCILKSLKKCTDKNNLKNVLDQISGGSGLINFMFKIKVYGP